MKLAIFDLDNTLIAGDSDAGWGEFLVERGLRDAAAYGQANARFYQDYLNGCLNINEFLQFQLAILGEYPPQQLHQWRDEYLDSKIRPLLLPKAQALLDEHRAAGAELLIITSTNRFITAPIAQMLGVEQLIATEVEMRDGRYTGKPSGTPSYAEGKVVRYHAWLQERGLNSVESWFYSDSRNDLPMLELVDHPVAVDPDPTLAQIAQARDWPILSLR